MSVAPSGVASELILLAKTAAARLAPDHRHTVARIQDSTLIQPWRDSRRLTTPRSRHRRIFPSGDLARCTQRALDGLRRLAEPKPWSEDSTFQRSDMHPRSQQDRPLFKTL